MFFNFFQDQSNLSAKTIQKSTGKEITRLASALILLATLGLYFSNTQAAVTSCTWQGGALSPGKWSDKNWSSDTGCSGAFPNNSNGKTFDVTHPRGTITLDRDITIDTFNLTGGTLAGSKNLTVNKTFNWTRGTVSGTGTVRASGGLELNGNLWFKDSATVINSAGQEANWRKGNILMFRGESGFLNEAGANFNVTVDNGRMLLLGKGPKFDNDGTFTTNLSSADSKVTIGAQMNNRNLVQALRGELQLSGGGTSTGLYGIGAEGKINFRGGVHNLLPGSNVIGASVEFSQLGVTNVLGGYNVGTTVLKPGGKVNFDSAIASQTVRLNMNGGTLSGTGTGALIVTGDAMFSSGQMNGSGQTIVGGKLDFNGNIASIRDTRFLIAAGPQASWTSGNILLRHAGSALLISPNTTFSIEADKGRMFGLGVLVNQGILEVNLADDAEPVVIKSNVSNFGSLVLQGDNLLIGNAFGGGDEINVFDNEATLFNGNFLQAETGTTFVDIAGNIAGEEYDVLNIFENAVLSGIFDITLDDIIPANSDFFDILTAKTITDNGLTLGGLDGDKFDFSIVNLAAGNQALRLHLASASTGLSLSAAADVSTSAVPLPGSIWLFISALLGIWRIGFRPSR